MLIFENDNITIIAGKYVFSNDNWSYEFTGKWRTNIKTGILHFEVKSTFLVDFYSEMKANFCFKTWFKHKILKQKFKTYVIYDYEWVHEKSIIIHEKPVYITNNC